MKRISLTKSDFSWIYFENGNPVHFRDRQLDTNVFRILLCELVYKGSVSFIDYELKDSNCRKFMFFLSTRVVFSRTIEINVVKIGSIVLFLVLFETKKYNGTPMSNLVQYHSILRFRHKQISYNKIA